MSEPKNLLEKKLAKFHPSLFWPNLEGANLKDLAGFGNSKGVPLVLVFPNDQASEATIIYNPALTLFSNAFSPPVGEARIAFAETLENLIIIRNRMRRHFFNVAY